MRRILGLFSACFSAFFRKKPVLAGETESEAVLSEMENAFFSELNLNELDGNTETYQEETGLSFSETVKKLILGELPWSQETMRNWFSALFLRRLPTRKRLLWGFFSFLPGQRFFQG